MQKNYGNQGAAEWFFLREMGATEEFCGNYKRHGFHGLTQINFLPEEKG